MSTLCIRYRGRLLGALLAVGMTSNSPAWAEVTTVQPSGSTVEMRAYGLGLIPLDGKFTRFHGWVRYDPSDSAHCELALQVDVGSLVMSNKAVRDHVTGPELMDADRFPDLSFHGICRGDAVVGDFTMHGQTHPMAFEYARSAGVMMATGYLRRAEWGITGDDWLGGAVVRITVSVPDPAGRSQA